jgi:hypothetical protein
MLRLGGEEGNGALGEEQGYTQRDDMTPKVGLVTRRSGMRVMMLHNMTERKCCDTRVIACCVGSQSAQERGGKHLIAVEHD